VGKTKYSFFKLFLIATNVTELQVGQTYMNEAFFPVACVQWNLLAPKFSLSLSLSLLSPEQQFAPSWRKTRMLVGSIFDLLFENFLKHDEMSSVCYDRWFIWDVFSLHARENTQITDAYAYTDIFYTIRYIFMFDMWLD